MNNKLKKIALLSSVFFLSSCGFNLNNVYKGDIFNSPVFARNYYTQWDNQLVKFKGQSGTSLESQKMFRTYQDFALTGLDEQSAVWNYFWLPKYQEGTNNYSYYRKMSAVDETFNYGYLSKLYDGQMFCGGDYQLSRVQINQEGFAQHFIKEGKAPKFFAMNFKASIDYTNTELIDAIHDEEPSALPNYPSMSHYSSIDLTVSIYTLENNQTVKYDYTNTLTNLKTNYSESFTGLEYEFYGFSLENLPANSRIVGYSINYTVDDPVVNAGKIKLGRDLDYSLMIYEVMFPFASWN